MVSFKLLGVASSLRVNSATTGLLRSASARMPADVNFELYVPKDLPLFNEDTENLPNAAIDDFRKKVRDADAVLFSLCEYNASVSGALKNAVDWASRGPYGNVWNKKPTAMIGAGGFGGIRASMHMRDIGVNTNMFMLNHPQLWVRLHDPLHQPVDLATGTLKDPAVEKQIDTIVASLIAWSKNFKA